MGLVRTAAARRASLFAVGILIVFAVVASGCTGHASDPPEARLGAPAVRTQPPQRGITARLSVPSTRMRAGSSMQVRIVVSNTTGHGIAVNGCRSLFQVLLTSNSYHPTPIWLSCLQRLHIPAGVSVHKMELRATYNECAGQGSDAGVPSCLPDETLPSLPAGEYEATLFQNAPASGGPDVSLGEPRPVRVVERGRS